MEFDKIYKFVAASFAVAYFVGLIIGIILISFNIGKIEESDITKSFYFSGQTSFRDVFTETMDLSIKTAILPFSFLIIAIKTGFEHSTYLLSPFLGQIKLATLLIPNVFYFISYILFSVIGLKLIATIIIFIVNRYLKKEHKPGIRLTIFQKGDVLFLYLALIGVIVGTIIQVYLSKMFFVFLINFRLITYILIILIYILIIAFSLYALYTTITSFIGNTKNKL